MNLAIRNAIRPSSITSLLRYASTSSEPAEYLEPVQVDDSEERQAREREIEKKRNVSRLSRAHFNVMNDRRPYEEPRCLAHDTVKYNRKQYGKYGIVSGVNPSLCWPSSRDLTQLREYESVAFPFTIQEMVASVQMKKQEEQAKIELREKELAAKYEKLSQWKKELKDKINKKSAEATAAKEKKERLVEEVRRHFGFKLDPRDERFQEMLAKREKEQKKQEKLARKEAKEKMMISKLQKQSVKISEKA